MTNYVLPMYSCFYLVKIEAVNVGEGFDKMLLHHVTLLQKHHT